MKKIKLLLILVFITFAASAQKWKSDFYVPTSKKTSQSFYQIQQDFYEYWESFNVKNGYYYIDGVKHKAGGWKQFKRWEWYWETRIDRKTGKFPSVNTLKIHNDFVKGKSTTSNNSSWENMGPQSSDGGYAGIGRINCIAFHPTNSSIFWAGAPSGGLWKTTDGGITWEVLTDELPLMGVSDIVIDNNYETSKTLYIATGDRDAGDNYSIGVLKSIDDGQTWETTGLSFDVDQGYRITRMLANPNQQSVMFAATNGGIFKSTDGGDTWTQKIDGIFFDMEFMPSNEDNVLFAVTSDYWGASTIYKTEDAGETWTEKYAFPTTTFRIEMDVAKSEPSTIYALSSTREGGMEGIYKSTNAGDTFTKVYDGTISGNNLLNWFANSTSTGGQGWYDLTLSVSPTNANTLYLGGINTWKSINGGTTWTINSHWYGDGGKPAVHADKHYMEFQDDNTFFEANDGGIYKTINGGQTWVDLTNGMIISQMYRLGVSQSVKDQVITGLQDNGSKLIYSGSWEDVKGGDGMECLIDYANDKIQYATYVYGQIDRTEDRWQFWYNVTDISENIPGGPNGAWVTPYIIDPKDHNTLYVGYSYVWKTTNRGNTWTKISTMNLSNKIRAMAISPSNNQYIYITDHDKFYRTDNGGSSWTNLSSHLPSTSNAITYIWVDEIDPLRVWITLGGYDGAKAFESFDGGDTWTDISAGLPSVPANCIVQNKLSKTNHLYIGTDIGVFFREGDSEWQPFNNDLPAVIVTELEIHYDTESPESSVLYASTYGRGLWKSNLSAFQLPEIQIANIEGPFYVSNDSTAQMEVLYTLNSTFTGNLFTVYLSDENGGFESPVEIGTLQSDEPGTINTIIPKGSAAGDRYRVKIISSSPEFESLLSNPFTVVLDNEKPAVTISSSTGSTTSSNNISVKITFNEQVTGFEQDDIEITNAVINVFSSTNAPEYNISISPEAAGQITVDIPADVAYDVAGNWNTKSELWSTTYTPTSTAALSDFGIRLFPNPTSESVSIEFGIHYTMVDITILDLKGDTFYKNQLNGSGTHKIPLENIAKGVYIVNINLNGKVISTRLVVR